MNLKQKAARITMFLGTVGVSAALIGAGVNATGAYFSDTKAGNISGTIGSIKVATDRTQIGFNNMLPGELQTVGDHYTNVGRNNADVWLVFNNADALHALNNLGTFGEVHIASDGTEIFASQNLNDNLAPASGTCGPFTPAGCWPVPQQIKLASNVAPGGGGDWTFGFKYASKKQGGNLAEATPAWNYYPLGSTANSGLPYQIVATQPGIAPGA